MLHAHPTLYDTQSRFGLSGLPGSQGGVRKDPP